MDGTSIGMFPTNGNNRCSVDLTLTADVTHEIKAETVGISTVLTDTEEVFYDSSTPEVLEFNLSMYDDVYNFIQNFNQISMLDPVILVHALNSTSTFEVKLDVPNDSSITETFSMANR